MLDTCSAIDFPSLASFPAELRLRQRRAFCFSHHLPLISSGERQNTSLTMNNWGPSTDVQDPALGTTIMAVEYDGGVVMGADSRTSTGTYIANRVSDKITSVADKIFVCRSGSAADTQAVVDMIRLYLQMHSLEINKQPEVPTAANLLNQVCYSNKDYLMAGMICAGWDERNGGKVFSVPLGGGIFPHPFVLGGSGSGYIYGYVDSNYRKGMSKQECETFVKNAVSLAMWRDGSSGGVVRLVTINKDGVEKQMISGDNLPHLAKGWCP